MLSLSFSFFSQCSDTDYEKGILIAKIIQLYVHHAQFNIDVKTKRILRCFDISYFNFRSLDFDKSSKFCHMLDANFRKTLSHRAPIARSDRHKTPQKCTVCRASIKNVKIHKNNTKTM